MYSEYARVHPADPCTRALTFQGCDAELAVRATIACMDMVNRYSKDKRKNDKIQLAAGIVAGPAWIIPGLDVFGGVVPLGFRIGEDVAPNGELYVHQSAVSRIEGLEPEARRDPSTAGEAEPLLFAKVCVWHARACTPCTCTRASC